MAEKSKKVVETSQLKSALRKEFSLKYSGKKLENLLKQIDAIPDTTWKMSKALAQKRAANFAPTAKSIERIFETSKRRYLKDIIHLLEPQIGTVDETIEAIYKIAPWVLGAAGTAVSAYVGPKIISKVLGK